VVGAGPIAVTDPETVAYLQAMTEDLETASGSDELAVARVCAVPPVDGRARLEPFLGGRLREWSGLCAGSAYGVLFSDVLDGVMTPMQTEDGESIRAIALGEWTSGDLDAWLGECVRQGDISTSPELTLRRLVFDGGRVIGAELDSPEGSSLVGADDGVALCPGCHPGDSGVAALGVDGPREIALVGRTAARFGRVELLELVHPR